MTKWQVRSIKSVKGKMGPIQPMDRRGVSRLSLPLTSPAIADSCLSMRKGHTRALKRHRRELIEPTIAEHHGRLVKNTGDGFLAIFDSPVEAVRCAIVIQQSMVGRNAALARDQWMLYRIGVNLGDVIVEADDIYGDGVNIAARLEGIANPGELYISGGVYEQIKNKLVCGYQSLGDRQVKNITEPISVYRVLPDPGAVIRARPTVALTAIVVTSVGVIASVAAAAATWYFFVWHPRQLAAVLEHAPAQTLNATNPAQRPRRRRYCRLSQRRRRHRDSPHDTTSHRDKARDDVAICYSPHYATGHCDRAARFAANYRT